MNRHLQNLRYFFHMKLKIFLLAITTASHLAIAQTPAQTSPETEINDIINAHRTELFQFMKNVRALPEEKKEEFRQSHSPKADQYVSALRKIIDTNLKDPAILNAYGWIAQYTRGTGLNASDYAHLTEHYLNDPKIRDLLPPLIRTQNKEAHDFVQQVSEKSSEKEIRGHALYALAMNLDGNEARVDEYNTLIEKIINDYPDLKIRGRHVAKNLKTERDAAINLAIGKTAPEIIGADVDGNEMKLSDYRGQIVVLDFWGHW